MAIAAHPSHTEADTVVGLMCQSIEHAHGKRFADALSCLDAGLRIAPAFFPCRLARARLLEDMDRFDEALADLNDILRRVQLPDVLAHFAALFERALARLEARLRKDSRDAAAYFQRGKVRSQARDHVAALHDYDLALRVNAGDVAVHMARGNALCELARFADAIGAYECILERDPDNALAWYNRGNALQKHGHLDGAIESYHMAVAIAPQFAEAWLEVAHCRLAQGEYADGWRLYEWRWRTAQLSGRQLASPQPRWLGDTSLEGRTIVLWAEQGYGDTIQFARFAAPVAKLAGGVVLRLPEALRSLLSTLDPRITVVGDGAPLPPHDCHCPLMSLPLALALALAGEPALSRPAYLGADVARGRDWQAWLGPAERPRIGLCWSGRQAGAAAYNPQRDMPLAALAPLAALDARFICLQKDYAPAEEQLLASLPGLQPIRHGLDSFADTAALIDKLDLVIAVDTAVAHLAGALGKPCWLLLKHSGEWRWRRERADTPWYPSIRIFRQQAEGEWAAPVRAVVEALELLISPASAAIHPNRPAMHAESLAF